MRLRVSLRDDSALLLALVLSGAAAADAAGADVTADRAVELRRLLRHDCGSCHGLTLKGGLGPPLTPGSLATRSADMLTAAIRDGVPGTAMPPWRPLLSNADIEYLLVLLRQGADE